jgi:cytochrome c-type biogenesis protein CcmE
MLTVYRLLQIVLAILIILVLLITIVLMTRRAEVAFHAPAKRVIRPQYTYLKP